MLRLHGTREVNIYVGFTRMIGMQPTTQVPGIHHVTAIAGDPTRNAAFYTETLGLRMVKRTVNHDDTSTYHFYYGDGEGTPGTNITFFPWADRGRPGAFGDGQTRTTAFLIPMEALDYWTDRLDVEDIDFETVTRFDEDVIRFDDPDGITLELVAVDDVPDGQPWASGPVPSAYQSRGFHSVTLALADRGPTADVLETMGFERVGEEDGRVRYRTDAGDSAVGSVVDLVETDLGRGRMGIGTVHHVAFKASDQGEQQMWQQALQERGLHVTKVVDRVYFHSIYFREPGGVLFEIATMKPGFTVDESFEELGTHLTLPDWLEDEREEIESRLVAFNQPAAIADGSGNP